MLGYKKWISLSTIAAALLVLSFCSNKPFSDEEPVLKRIIYTLNRQHYAPLEINDSFSVKIFQNILENMDGNKQFFTQEDIANFSAYKYSIDDQINAGRFDFFDTVWQVMQSRLDFIEPLVKAQLEKPYNYSEELNYFQGEDERNYPKSLNEITELWTLWTRYQTVDKLYNKLEGQKNLKGPDSIKNIKPFDTLELKAREETKKLVENWFKRWRKMDRQDQIAFFANTIAEVYDPHTNYFPPADRDNFDISMTGKLEGIGATLSERDGYIKVERIVPGSASYKQGDLKAGDLILKVGQAEEDPVDVVDMKLDDAIQLIRGKKGTEVRLTVKKPDGVIQVVPIVRDVVVIEESYARSALVEFKGDKYGVIQLPSFYADFSAEGRGRHSSGDVAKEISKLKDEKIKGIILDLRNNGGGSLADAIDMSGLFISSGPIVQVKDPSGRIQQASDQDTRVQYDGPLVVMTNTYSASASEILAAALQDYKRAVIVGSKSTFGKGTVQTMIPLRGGSTKIFPRGFGDLKVTIQKFYRINGGTTQLVGVEPDVVLPDIYDEIDRGEKEMDYHLEFDEIPKAKYTELENKSLKRAIKQGQKEISKSDYYKLVSKRAKQIAELRKGMTYPLSLESYKEFKKEINERDKEFKDFKYVGKSDTLYPLSIDLNAVQGDSIKTEQRKVWMKGYSKDAGLDIALEVLKCWKD